MPTKIGQYFEVISYPAPIGHVLGLYKVCIGTYHVSTRYVPLHTFHAPRKYPVNTRNKSDLLSKHLLQMQYHESTSYVFCAH